MKSLYCAVVLFCFVWLGGCGPGPETTSNPQKSIETKAGFDDLEAEALNFGVRPAWIAPRALGLSDARVGGGAVETHIADRQYYFDGSGTQIYYETVVRANTVKALGQTGRLSAVWYPSAQRLTVHDVHILRDGEVIDVLSDGQTFEILRREPKLASDYISGVKTAFMQVAGLRVNDAVRFSYTVHSRNMILPETPAVFLPLNSYGKKSLQTVRFAWPEDFNAKWQTSEAVKEIMTADLTGPLSQIAIDLDKLPKSEIPRAAPLRELLTDFFEVSSIRQWSDISKTYWPYMDKASDITKGSELSQIARTIAKDTKDPVEQIEAALKFTQSEIRYVYSGLASGAYMPTHASTAAAQRFGDCKAKTAILLALLREFGIKAEPVLVSTNSGNLIEGRLPNMGAFNHIVVRAQHDGKTYWLDGTKSAEISLSRLSPVTFEWGLPVTKAGNDLIAIAAEPAAYISRELSADINASEGMDKPIALKAKMILRGQKARYSRSVLETPQTDDDKTHAKALFRSLGKISDETASLSVDPETGDVTALLTGTLKFTEKVKSRRTYYAIPDFKFSGTIQSARKKSIERERKAPRRFSPMQKEKTDIKISLPQTYPQAFFATGGNFEVTGDTVSVKRSFTLEGQTAKFSKRSEIKALYIPNDEFMTLATQSDKHGQGWIPYFYQAGTKPVVKKEPADGPLTVKDYSRKGTDALNDRRYEDAIASYDLALNADDKTAGLWALRGTAALRLKRMREAKSNFKTALSLSPENLYALEGMGVIHYEDGEYASSIRYLDQVLRIDPTRNKSRVGRAYSLAKMKRFDEAVMQIDSLIIDFPGNTKYKKIRKSFLRGDERHERKQDEFVEAFSDKPDITLPEITLNIPQ